MMQQLNAAKSSAVELLTVGVAVRFFSPATQPFVTMARTDTAPSFGMTARDLSLRPLVVGRTRI